MKRVEIDKEVIPKQNDRLTQHKRFVSYGTYPNPSLTLKTSFMLGTLFEMPELSLGKGKMEQEVIRR
ncbi:hypothetical protein ES703_125016 [subsurface metagenome]